MKFVFAAIALVITNALAAAVLEEDSFSIDNITTRAFDLKVMDDRFPGRIFQGTAKSIYEEMKALKPEAFVMDVTVKARSLDKRSSLNCNWGSYIIGPSSCDDSWGYLKKLDRARCYVDASPACARVSCSYKCATYLCNKTNSQFWVSCGDIANDQAFIKSNCPHEALSTASGARDFDTHFIGLTSNNC